MNDKKNEFLQKLKALLLEYDATIEAGLGEGTDTHGMYDHHIRVTLRNPECRWDEILIFRTETDESYLTAGGLP